MYRNLLTGKKKGGKNLNVYHQKPIIIISAAIIQNKWEKSESKGTKTIDSEQSLSKQIYKN